MQRGLSILVPLLVSSITFGQGYTWLELNKRLSAGDTLSGIYYLKDLLDSEGDGPWEAHFNLGLLYQKSAMDDSAVHHYIKSTIKNENLYEPHYFIGHYFFKNGKMNSAIDHYSKYLSKDPDNLEVVHYRGQALMKEGEFYLAISDWTALIKNKEEVGVVFNRGLCHLAISAYQEAIEDFDRVIEMKGNVLEAKYYKGICFEKLFEYKKAESIWKAVVKQDNLYKNAFYRLSDLYYKSGKNKKACKNLSLALELGYDIKTVNEGLKTACGR